MVYEREGKSDVFDCGSITITDKRPPPEPEAPSSAITFLKESQWKIPFATAWATERPIAREIELSGTGVHSGAPVSVILHPAEADTGLRFILTKRGRVTAEIPANHLNVKNCTLCTVIGDEKGATISTVEWVV